MGLFYELLALFLGVLEDDLEVADLADDLEDEEDLVEGEVVREVEEQEISPTKWKC